MRIMQPAIGNFCIAMGYPTKIKAAVRKLNDLVVIVSCPFSYLGLFNIGARTALIQCEEGIVVWSPMIYGDYIVEGLQKLTGNSSTNPADYNVTHIVALSTEHYLGVDSFTAHFKKAKVISSEATTRVSVDYKLTDAIANKVITLNDITRANGSETEKGFNELEFVYLPLHFDKEVVVYLKPQKMLFQADILMNLGIHGTTTGDVVLEQYSPETGYPKGFNPHGWISFATRYFQPFSKVYNLTFTRLFPRAHLSKARKGLAAICDLDFETIVPAHGNVVTTRAKEAMRHVCRLENDLQ